MDNNQIELFLLHLITFCFGMILFLTIIRLIKIFVYKKVDNADDILAILMFGVFIAIFSYIYYRIKKKFKKESEKQIKEESNGIKDVFEM